MGRELAARFAADPETERDLAINAVRFDAHGAAWDALMKLVAQAEELVPLYHLFGAAYQAERIDDYFVAIKGKPSRVLVEFAGCLSRPLRDRFRALAGLG